MTFCLCLRLAQTGFFSIDGRNEKVLDQGSSSMGEVAKLVNKMEFCKIFDHFVFFDYFHQFNQNSQF